MLQPPQPPDCSHSTFSGSVGLGADDVEFGDGKSMFKADGQAGRGTDFI
jgi:hypothetical protein